MFRSWVLTTRRVQIRPSLKPAASPDPTRLRPTRPRLHFKTDEGWMLIVPRDRPETGQTMWAFQK